MLVVVGDCALRPWLAPFQLISVTSHWVENWDPRASLADPEHFSGPQGHNLFAGFSRYTATPERDRPGLRMLRRWSPAHSGRRAKARALIVCAVEPFREAFSWSRAAPGWPGRWRRAGCLEPSVQARRSHHHAPARLCPSL